jgi:hypothetical protein
MKKIILGVSLVFLLALPAAAEIMPGGDPAADSSAAPVELTDEPIAAAPVPAKNAYLHDRSVLVETETTGDLLAAGWSVTANAPVRADALLAGMSVNVLAPVEGDLRAAGQDVAVDAYVGGEAMLAGRNVSLTAEADVTGDLAAYGDTVTVNGSVGGDLHVRAAKIVLNGTVAGNADLEATESLVLGPDARVDGGLDYRAPKGQTFRGQVADVSYLGAVEDGRGKAADWRSDRTPGRRFGDWFGGAVAMLVLAAVAFLISKRGTAKVAETGGRRFWSSVGLGLAVMVGVPVVIVVLAVTIIGLPLALLVLLAYLAFLLVTFALTGPVAGEWLVRRVPRLAKREFGWMIVIGGVVGLKVVSAVPFVGGLVFFLASLSSAGALVLSVHGWWRARPARSA